jgi:hypothetical protein
MQNYLSQFTRPDPSRPRPSTRPFPTPSEMPDIIVTFLSMFLTLPRIGIEVGQITNVLTCQNWVGGIEEELFADRLSSAKSFRQPWNTFINLTDDMMLFSIFNVRIMSRSIVARVCSFLLYRELRIISKVVTPVLLESCNSSTYMFVSNCIHLTK